MIQDGEADIVITGAAESPISPISMACFDPIKATSQRNDDPAHASRPFDRDRDGFVMGEGGAVLVLEEMEAALARGAHIYCEVAGFAGRGNAYHMTGLTTGCRGDDRGDPRRDAPGRHQSRGHRLHQRARLGHEAERPPRDGRLQEGARRARLRDPDQLDQVDDRALARRRSARSRWPPARWRSTRGVVPPTANWENPDPECDLDYTPIQARRTQVDVALSTGSGFGGFQSAMIFALPPEVNSVRHVITSLPDTEQARRDHRHRRRRAERDRHRRLVEGHRRGRERASAASRASTRPATRPSSPAR